MPREPPSAEGRAASVQSEARARGAAICSLRLGCDGARDALASSDVPPGGEADARARAMHGPILVGTLSHDP